MISQENAEPPSIELQFAAPEIYVPRPEDLRSWVVAAAESETISATLRVVTADEIRALNRDYRDRDKPTNVLSFPSDYPSELNLSYLGDIAICAEVVNREAEEQDKPVDHHWAHMVIHGVLHLRGFDHIQAADAETMESLETLLLDRLGIPDPYNQDYSNRLDHV